LKIIQPWRQLLNNLVNLLKGGIIKPAQPYNPFERIRPAFVDILVNAQRYHVVAQRFQWPGVPENKGFMLTAYPHPDLAANHHRLLQPGEGKVLDLHKEESVKRLKDLTQPDSSYQFFYSATRDKDARQKLVREYETSIKEYSKTHYGGNFVFGIRVEAGQLYGTFSYEKQTSGVLFYNIIK